MTRYIRLREWDCNLDTFKIPSDDVVYTSNGLRKERFHLRTDDNGFIRTGNQLNHTTRCIAILGDSVVENMFVHEKQRMCAVLERKLDEAGKSAAVLNAGMSGASTLHSINLLLNKILPLKPAAIVLMSGIIDLSAAYLRKSFWSTDTHLAPVVTHGTSGMLDTDVLERPAFAEREKLLSCLVSITQLYNIPLFLTTIAHHTAAEAPFITSKYRDVSHFEKRVRDRQKINAHTKAFCLAHKLPLLDLEKLLSSEDGMFYDEFHLSERGSEVCGTLLADFLKRHSKLWVT